jgi:hypothetical protein
MSIFHVAIFQQHLHIEYISLFELIRYSMKKIGKTSTTTHDLNKKRVIKIFQFATGILWIGVSCKKESFRSCLFRIFYLLIIFWFRFVSVVFRLFRFVCALSCFVSVVSRFASFRFCLFRFVSFLFIIVSFYSESG